MLAIWSLVLLTFLNPTWTSESSQFTYCWRLSWKILSIILLVYEMSVNCVVVWIFFVIASSWDWNENWLFPVLGRCQIFQICWYIEFSTFTASSFRVWNSSTGFPSPPLALFLAMLPKAHLNSHSRMSGSRWLITPLWLYESLRSFSYSSSSYSYHLFWISSASVRSIPCLSFIAPISAWNVLLAPLLLLKRSLVLHSTVSLYFFTVIT